SIVVLGSRVSARAAQAAVGLVWACITGLKTIGSVAVTNRVTWARDVIPPPQLGGFFRLGPWPKHSYHSDGKSTNPTRNIFTASFSSRSGPTPGRPLVRRARCEDHVQRHGALQWFHGAPPWWSDHRRGWHRRYFPG